MARCTRPSSTIAVGTLQPLLDRFLAENGEGGADTVACDLLHLPVEGIGECDDPRPQRNLITLATVGVAAAVEALMVEADQKPRRPQGLHVVDGGLPPHRMEPVLGHLGRRQLLGVLGEDAVGNAELADVVEKGGDADRLHVRGWQPEGARHLFGDGGDLTIVTYGSLVFRATQAAKELEHEGVQAEILDLRSLQPYDWDLISASVKKTSRAIVLYEDNISFGYGAEIAARIADELFEWLDAPVRRLAGKDTYIPYHPTLEDAVLPQPGDILRACRELAAF